MKTKLFALMVGLAGLAFGSVASANVLVLTDAANLYQQTDQNPCIFSNPPCYSPGNNGGFASTNLDTGGNLANYDVYSPDYAGSLLHLIGGTNLLLGVDINQSGSIQELTFFGMYIQTNGTGDFNLVDTFGPADVEKTANGTGWSDYTLSGFSTFNDADIIKFRFTFSDANDGTENIFLIHTGTEPCQTDCGSVPEPMSVALFGIGALGLALTRRRKQLT